MTATRAPHPRLHAGEVRRGVDEEIAAGRLRDWPCRDVPLSRTAGPLKIAWQVRAQQRGSPIDDELSAIEIS
jgi:hypothetical protein